MDGENLPQAVGEIPWGHNIVLLFKLEDPIPRLWYAQKTIEHGWSRAVLVHQVESGLYEREGKAVTNFDRKSLPDTYSSPSC
jgi:predicted nuclease of restriction endonuclease-like (RecB) superfamily